MKKHFNYSIGPWNIHTGADPFGPPVRKEIRMEEKLENFKALGIDAVQLHDDDAIPEIDRYEGKELIQKAKVLKSTLENTGLVTEFVAPRLWESDMTKDGAFTANLPELRKYAKERSLKSVELCNELGTKNIVLWLAREGNFVPESKSAERSIHYIKEAINNILEYDKEIKILIEPKPNEPVDKSFVPTIGHALAVSTLTADPNRVGVLLESAHSILAGLDPADDMAFALAQKKLWGVHLNDQNGLKFDQDRSFGSVNIRQAFNQIRVLLENDYGQNGEYVGLDVKALRTQSDEHSYKHVRNSLHMVESLVKKVKGLDQQHIEQLVQSMDYEELDRYIVTYLLGNIS